MIVKNLKKAAGEDGIVNEAWIYGGEKLIRTMAEQIIGTWNGKGLPKEWKGGIIKPIY